MDAEVTGLFERSKSAIVRIHAEDATDLALSPRSTLVPSHRVGSGFFIDTEGRLVTAGSLVENASEIWIDWQGRHVPAKLLGRDRLTNLALLQINTNQPTPCLQLGNSDDLRIGSVVVAIGFPYEMQSVPVVGFVAGVDISCGRKIFPVSYIRAGCRLRPGQGGGPLLNASGKVVGLVVAAHGDDHCYSVPVNAVKKICADITAHGAPQYPWVGLDVSEHQLTNTLQWQVSVREIYSNTPAARAGFYERDILLKIATNEIHRSADVLNTMFYRHCGETMPMTVLRDGVTQEVRIVVGKRPPEPDPIVPSAPLPVMPVNTGPQAFPAAATH